MAAGLYPTTFILNKKAYIMRLTKILPVATLNDEET